MEKATFRIDGHECFVYTTGTSADTLLIQPVDEHDLAAMENELEAIGQHTDVPFRLAAFKVNDWQTELTPWTSPAVFGRVPFGDKAAITLTFITDQLLPKLACRRVMLGGYSLAGLFALWAGSNTDRFDAIAAASPSVWYPGWMEYAGTHRLHSGTVYLSLGDKEERTKHPVMARVGDNIRRQYRLLSEQGVNTMLEWNEGNHFRDAHLRMAKGFAWIINNVNG